MSGSVSEQTTCETSGTSVVRARADKALGTSSLPLVTQSAPQSTQRHDARLYPGAPIQFRIRQSPITTSMATATPHSGPTTTPEAARMDQPGRPEGDSDIVEQYNNPKELA